MTSSPSTASCPPNSPSISPKASSSRRCHPRKSWRGDYSKLDPLCVKLIQNSVERKPWRLYIHQPYPHWYKKQTCILGDAAHPMMPHQSQGACQAIEDAAALGIIFSPEYNFTNDVEAVLALPGDSKATCDPRPAGICRCSRESQRASRLLLAECTRCRARCQGEQAHGA